MCWWRPPRGRRQGVQPPGTPPDAPGDQRQAAQDGAGNTIIDGGGIDRVFYVDVSVSLALCGLTIRNGQAPVSGGGIRNLGTVTLADSLVSGNSATTLGGGISNDGNATVNRSTISGDHSSFDGGGIFSHGMLTVTQSTISGNTSGQNGGGMLILGGVLMFSGSLVTNNASGSDFSGGGEDTGDQRPTYDRQLLLGGAKRNAVLELWEVQRYGIDSYGDANYVSIYGMRPADWHARGVRLLGRTAVECTRDGLGDAIGKDVAAVAATAPAAASALVIDPFAGSGNTLYWLLQHLPGALGLGFELDAAVFRLTKRNLAALRLPIDVRNIDYLSGLTEASVATDQLLITFIAPPWGDALDKTFGLDLRRTTPPITEIVDFLLHRFRHNHLLCGIQVFEAVEPGSLADLRTRFNWSAMRVYGLNAPGDNHGILLGTKGWTP